MNAIHLVLLQFVVLGLVGVPLAYLSDPQGIGYLAQQTERVGVEAVTRAYQWTVYAAVILALLFYLTGIRRRIVAYQQQSEILLSRRTYIRAWTVFFAGGLVCALFLFVQSGFRHPGLAGIGLDYLDYALLRVQTSETINMNVYNLGLHLFTSFAVIIAVFYLKSFWRVVVTIALFVILGVFSLAKAPMASAILVWLFFYLTIRRPSMIAMGLMAVMMIAVLALMYVVSKSTGPDQSLLTVISTRIFYGQFADLPYYFDYFETTNVSLVALLPPYVQHWMGLAESIPSAARLVMEYTNPAAVAGGSAGVANTLFVGEAFAWGGLWGVILAPFWVGAHFWVVTALLARLKKNMWSAFALAYLFHRMSDALIGGFSYFVFSSIHLVLLAILGLIVFHEMRRVTRFRTADSERMTGAALTKRQIGP